jgi:F0F1-type ATP synthase assembly protein I
MTGPDNSSSNTRPISVAELLAKNGTIGAPPVGGRRRRRRGNADAVTVAELTGEIPIVTDRDDEPEPEPEPGNGAPPQAVEPEAAEPEAEVPEAAEPEAPEADVPEPEPESPEPGGAEGMSPDPVIDVEDEDEDLLDSTMALTETDPPVAPDTDDIDDTADEGIADIADTDDDKLPSYLRSSQDKLFGGPTVDDDAAPPDALDEDVDEEGDEDERRAEPQAAGGMSSALRGAWIVGQCIIAVAFGAGLFIAFDQLWKWNNIVALVLSVLVILGLVVGVRVVRKTEDIGSTLIAVAVGALVTLGPLALLQSG